MNIKKLLGKETVEDIQRRCFTDDEFKELFEFNLATMDYNARRAIYLRLGYLWYSLVLSPEDIKAIAETGKGSFVLETPEQNALISEGYVQKGFFYPITEISVDDRKNRDYVIRYSKDQYCHHLDDLCEVELAEIDIKKIKAFADDAEDQIEKGRCKWEAVSMENMINQAARLRALAEDLAALSDEERAQFYAGLNTEEHPEGDKETYAEYVKFWHLLSSNIRCLGLFLISKESDEEKRKALMLDNEAVATSIFNAMHVVCDQKETLVKAQMFWDEKIKAIEEARKKAQEALEAQEKGDKKQPKGDGNKAQKQMPIVATIVQGIIDAIKGHGYELPHKLTLYDSTGATIQDLTLLSILEENKMLHLITLEDLGKIVTWRNERNLDVEPLYHFQDAWKAEYKARAEADSNNNSNS